MRANLLFNFGSIVVNSGLAFVFAPIFLNRFGSDGYGVLGVYFLFFGFMSLLDLGMTPTFLREVSSERDKDNLSNLSDLSTSFEIIFLIVGFTIALAFILLSDEIIKVWLEDFSMNDSDLNATVNLMGANLACRWFGSLWKSGLIGADRQVSLNILLMKFSLWRYVGVFIFMSLAGFSINNYLLFTLFINVFEAISLRWRFRTKVLNHRSLFQFPGSFNIEILRRIAPYAASVAFTAVIWTFVQQIDKLTLSVFLTLEEFGYYTVLTVATVGLGSLYSPIMQASLPRLIALAGKDLSSLANLYYTTTKLNLVIVCSVLSYPIFLNEEFLYYWSHNHEFSDWAASFSAYIFAGNIFVALAAMQYSIQVAFGNLKLHVYASFISGAFQVIVILFSAMYFGVKGVAIAFFTLKLLIFIIYPQIVHYRFIRNQMLEWYIHMLEALIVVFLALFPALFVKWFFFQGKLVPINYIFIFIFFTAVVCLVYFQVRQIFKSYGGSDEKI